MRAQVWRSGDTWHGQVPVIRGLEVSANNREDIPALLAEAVFKMTMKSVDPALVEMEDVSAPS